MMLDGIVEAALLGVLLVYQGLLVVLVEWLVMLVWPVLLVPLVLLCV